MREFDPYASDFCWHDALRRGYRRRVGHRTCWPPYFAKRECPTCGATVEVRA